LNDDGWSKIGEENPMMDGPTPVTESAKLWDGWGTALKPAWEPLLVCMKPLEGTFTHNAQTHGVAGLNIDGCRVWDKEVTINTWDKGVQPFGGGAGRTQKDRWPSNLLFDESAAEGLGDKARYFYCAKVNKKDRGEGNKHPTVKPRDLMRYLVRLVSMPEGTHILDPFAGSGSTGVACALEGVEFTGIELDTGFSEIARTRISQAK